jgi:hypothetical protein
MIFDFFKLVIHQNSLHRETNLHVYIDDALKQMAQFGSRAMWHMFNGY